MQESSQLVLIFDTEWQFYFELLTSSLRDAAYALQMALISTTFIYDVIFSDCTQSSWAETKLQTMELDIFPAQPTTFRGTKET